MEPAMIDLVRELDDPLRRRDPELEVEIEMLDEMLLDPWFQRSEAEIALIEDDPDARIHEICITGYAAMHDAAWKPGLNATARR
jgi:hypothetical protein